MVFSVELQVRNCRSRATRCCICSGFSLLGLRFRSVVAWKFGFSLVPRSSAYLRRRVNIFHSIPHTSMRHSKSFGLILNVVLMSLFLLIPGSRLQCYRLIVIRQPSPSRIFDFYRVVVCAVLACGRFFSSFFFLLLIYSHFKSDFRSVRRCSVREWFPHRSRESPGGGGGRQTS